MRKLVLGITIFLTSGGLQAQTLRLSLAEAVQSALENNASVAVAEDMADQAQAKAKEQRSFLLPNVGGTLAYTNQTVNLGSRGLQFAGIPTRVGPFGVTDARLQYSEPVLDLSLIRRYQATRRSADATQFDIETAKNSIAAMVSRLYFGVQRADEMVRAVNAQIQLDEAIAQLARDRQNAGVGTGLDVTRAGSRLAADRYALIQANNDRRTAQLQLLRAIGASMGSTVELTDAMTPSPAPTMSLTEALAAAFRDRPELKAEQRKLEAARIGVSAAHAERLPSAQAFADYGDSGNANVFVPTRNIGIQVSVPLFDGGRRSAHAGLAASQLKQAETRARDVHDQIELEVREAMDTLASANEQVTAAESALQLAQEELDLSRLRFEAQVTTQIDVISAQAALSAARSRRVNALYGVKAAEIELQRTIGVR